MRIRLSKVLEVELIIFFTGLACFRKILCIQMYKASCQKSHGDTLGRDALTGNGDCQKWWEDPVINK